MSLHVTAFSPFCEGLTTTEGVKSAKLFKFELPAHKAHKSQPQQDLA
jgi:hypothetical protein